MTKHWATMKEAGALTGVRFMVWVNSNFGRSVFNVVLVPVIAYFFIRRTDARQSSMKFLSKVKRSYPERFGNRSLTWLSFRHFLAFGHSLLDKYLVWAETSASVAISVEDEKMLYGAAESARGCLVIGSHFGSLEYSRAIASRYPGLVINVLLYDQHAKKFSSFMDDSQPGSQMNLIQVTELDLELALRLKEKVQQGEWVVITGDRVPVGDDKRVSRAIFFGEKADFPVGPYVLASLLHCPVYLLHCFRLEDNYRVVIEFFGDSIQIPRLNRQQAYEKAAQKFALSLEKQVVQSPLQWFNFYDFWDSHD
jgi:predicted LPLAT superfamily acyltransferase